MKKLIENTEEPNTREIDENLENLFTEVGLKREDYKLYAVEGDGACACNCVGLHCHGDCKLGPYVRRNVNEYLVDNWPFFKDSYTFPHTQIVGSKQTTFKNEQEYLDFLRNDSTSRLLWVDHQDLQIVANMYQMKIHVLTVGIHGGAQALKMDPSGS